MFEENILNPDKVDRGNIGMIFTFLEELQNSHKGNDLIAALRLVKSFPNLRFDGRINIRVKTSIGSFKLICDPLLDGKYVAIDPSGREEIFNRYEEANAYLSDRYRYLLAISIIRGVFDELEISKKNKRKKDLIVPGDLVSR